MKKDNLDYKIENVIGHITEPTDRGWSKSVIEVRVGDKPAAIDIRNVNIDANVFGKGIQITKEECDVLVDLLLENGFGSTEAIDKAYKQRKFIIE